MKKLLVAVLFSGAAFAAGAKHDDAAFKGLDKDADGAISAEEAAGNTELTSSFATLDKDGDGKLNATEFKAHGTAKQPAKKAEKPAK